MENNRNLSRQELEQLLEKAKRDTQAMLDRMTPEERAEAERKAQNAIEADRAAMQQLLDSAAEAAAAFPPKKQAAPKFCANCGAPAQGGNFCGFCGSPLRTGG